MKIFTIQDTIYQSSVIIFHSVLERIREFKDIPWCFASDFSFQYTQFGGFGNLWAVVTVDPDGLFFNVYFYLSILSISISLTTNHHHNRTHSSPCNRSPNSRTVKKKLE